MPSNILDPVTNFATTTLASGITSGATSVTLTSASRQPDPATLGAYDGVIWDLYYASASEDPNAEIVRVTAITGSVLTITRAQQGTSAVAHNTSGRTYAFSLTTTAKMFQDIELLYATKSSPTFTGTISAANINATGAVSSIYSTVGTSANATLAIITEGLTIPANLVTSPYVAEGYTAGVIWASTDDNATKPKAGIFAKTTGSGTYVYIGTSNSYATGITSSIAVGPNGELYGGAGNFAGLLTTMASITGSAGLRIPHGTAPLSPVNGDMWTTTAGAYVRINGVTKTFTLT